MAGVGTHLKTLVAWFEPPGGCVPCNQKAAILDANSPQWAELNIDTVVNWLMENAKKHYAAVSIPGIEQVTKIAAKQLVLTAIARAKADLEPKK